jgi:addiction module HigA family antidote
MNTKRRPTHPGSVFKHDVLEPLHITVTEAAKHLGVSRKAISELINEKCSLSPEMAVRISIATHTTPESWINMQTKLDLWTAEQKKLEIAPFKTAC